MLLSECSVSVRYLPSLKEKSHENRCIFPSVQDECGSYFGHNDKQDFSSFFYPTCLISSLLFFFNSLVELCSLGGLDLPPSDGNGSNDDENWMSKRTVSMSSDVSTLSSVTLLDMEELDCLLNDVKSLDDETLEVLEIHM